MIVINGMMREIMRLMMGMMVRMMVAVVSGVKVVELSVERPTIGGKPESGGCS